MIVTIAAVFDCTVGLLSDTAKTEMLPVLKPLAVNVSVVVATTLLFLSSITTLNDWVERTTTGLRKKLKDILAKP